MRRFCALADLVCTTASLGCGGGSQPATKPTTTAVSTASTPAPTHATTNTATPTPTQVALLRGSRRIGEVVVKGDGAGSYGPYRFAGGTYTARFQQYSTDDPS